MEITKIPALPRQELYGNVNTGKVRVAAYARVSTELDEQESSFENQQDHFRKLADEHTDDWDFVGLYTDDGISGKFADMRNGFTSLLGDCDDGKIDKIITKSVSRFARNTLECVATARRLKEKGIGVYFEKENIDTLSENSEFILTLMASLAEEESRSISRNVKWTVKKKFERGEVILTTSTFLGYDKGPDKNLVINEGEAMIIKKIYKEFLDGKSPAQIAKGLNNSQMPTPNGGTKWLSSGVTSILKNEKYKGDVILQKTYKPDFLSRERIKNEGQEEMYYIKDHHPAIIDRDEWDYVQLELRRRCQKPDKQSGIRDYTSEKVDFSGIIVCGECNAYYQKHRQYHGGTRRYTEVYLCAGHRLTGEERCPAKPIRASDFEALYMRTMNHLIDDADKVLPQIEKMKNEITGANRKNILLEKQYVLDRKQEELLHAEDIKRRTDNKEIRLKIDEIRSAIRRLQNEIEELKYLVYFDTYKLKKLYEMESFITSGEKIEYFDPEKMRKTIYTISVEPGQLFANLKFECGLEVRELIIRKVKKEKDEVKSRLK